jgi:hypothetical protein
MVSDVSIAITSSILHSHLFDSLLLLVGADELSGREGREITMESERAESEREMGTRDKKQMCAWRSSVKNANETKSDCNARIQLWYRTFKKK